MPEPDFEKILVAVARALDQAGITYLVTGGLGVIAWGRPRLTLDIDLLAEIERTQVNLIERAFRDVFPEGYVDRSAIEDAVARRGEFNVIDPISGVKIDIWVAGDVPIDRSRIERRMVRDIRNYPVAFSSPEDLIVIKLQWFRDSESTRHLEDAQSIVDISGEQLDRAYLGQWVERLGLEAEFGKLRF